MQRKYINMLVSSMVMTVAITILITVIDKVMALRVEITVVKIDSYNQYNV